METQKLENIVARLGTFKDLKRTGWLKNKVLNPESDAEHSFSLAVLVMLLAPKELNLCRCLELALVHDLAEIYTGDYTPADNIAPQHKYQEENAAAEQLAIEWHCPKIKSLIEEYNAKSSEEALFVSALDKVDTVMTARYYDDCQRAPKKLTSEFAAHAMQCLDKFDKPYINELKSILIQLQKEN